MGKDLRRERCSGNKGSICPAALVVWKVEPDSGSAVDEFGADVESLRSLQRLYQSAERWEELAESYERHLGIVEDDAQRLDLQAKLGDLRREHLHDLQGALDAYRNALSIDSSHGPSRNALEKMLEVDDTAARRDAA